MKQHLIAALYLCLSNLTTAQQPARLPDSLSHKTYKYLDDRIYFLRKDTAKAAVYLSAYLTKSKKEKNWPKLMHGYQNAVHQSPEKLKLVYADSMIYAAKQSHDQVMLGSAFLSKGIAYYGQKKYEEAYNHYITANNYISKSDDAYLIHKVKYHMAQIKYYLGFYDEAISLFRGCLDYFKSENARAYLNTLHSLGVCYNRIGNYGLCSKTNRLGLSEGLRVKDEEMKPYFLHSEGINEYFQHNYDSSIRNIQSALDSIIGNKDFANESVGYFYIGKSYWALGKREKALPYFLKVDALFRSKNYIRPDLREVYELLISYYKSKNDLKAQLFYIDQLLKADTLLHETFNYLIGKIHKEYDTKELLAEKEKITEQLLWEKYYDYIFISIILLLFALSLFLTYRHFTTRKFYKKKFDELMSQSADQKISALKTKKQKELLDIPQETVELILQRLEKFEQDKKYLAWDLRLAALADILHSNQKYVSKIIWHYKEKDVVDYINDLKIDYVIELLKNNRLARNYTNAALAKEAGFSSTQRFVNAFKARTEISTSYFIEQIKKEQL